MSENQKGILFGIGISTVSLILLIYGIVTKKGGFISTGVVFMLLGAYIVYAIISSEREKREK